MVDTSRKISPATLIPLLVCWVALLLPCVLSTQSLFASALMDRSHMDTNVCDSRMSRKAAAAMISSSSSCSSSSSPSSSPSLTTPQAKRNVDDQLTDGSSNYLYFNFPDEGADIELLTDALNRLAMWSLAHQILRSATQREMMNMLTYSMWCTMIVVGSVFFGLGLIILSWRVFWSVREAAKDEPVTLSFLFSIPGIRYLQNHFRYHLFDTPLQPRRRFASFVGAGARVLDLHELEEDIDNITSHMRKKRDSTTKSFDSRTTDYSKSRRKLSIRQQQQLQLQQQQQQQMDNHHDTPTIIERATVRQASLDSLTSIMPKRSIIPIIQPIASSSDLSNEESNSNTSILLNSEDVSSDEVEKEEINNIVPIGRKNIQSLSSIESSTISPNGLNVKKMDYKEPSGELSTLSNNNQPRFVSPISAVKLEEQLDINHRQTHRQSLDNSNNGNISPSRSPPSNTSWRVKSEEAMIKSRQTHQPSLRQQYRQQQQQEQQQQQQLQPHTQQSKLFRRFAETNRDQSSSRLSRHFTSNSSRNETVVSFQEIPKSSRRNNSLSVTAAGQQFDDPYSKKILEGDLTPPPGFNRRHSLGNFLKSVEQSKTMLAQQREEDEYEYEEEEEEKDNEEMMEEALNIVTDYHNSIDDNKSNNGSIGRGYRRHHHDTNGIVHGSGSWSKSGGDTGDDELFEHSNFADNSIIDHDTLTVLKRRISTFLPTLPNSNSSETTINEHGQLNSTCEPFSPSTRSGLSSRRWFVENDATSPDFIGWDNSIFSPQIPLALDLPTRPHSAIDEAHHHSPLTFNNKQHPLILGTEGTRSAGRITPELYNHEMQYHHHPSNTKDEDHSISSPPLGRLSPRESDKPPPLVASGSNSINLGIFNDIFSRQ